MATTDKTDIKSLTLPQLEAYIKGLGQPAYRAGQLYSWLHNRLATGWGQMTNLPASLRETLASQCELTVAKVERKQVSKDGTVKYLFSFADGECVESVLMQYKHGCSLCISTQVGCRMGCGFCASTLGGLVRSLTPAEMLEEVYAATRDSNKRVDSLVLMGIGEPLDNLDNVLTFLNILSSPQGLNLSLRHVSLSTCGLVDKIDELAEHRLGLTLSISLHAPNDEIRSKTMPVNRRWNIDQLLAACKRYFEKTGRRISFEYALIAGVNDAPEHAMELARRLRGFGCHVNLIPVNEVPERVYRRSPTDSVSRFKATLEAQGINTTVRRSLGGDISAACGQLRREQTARGGEEG